jgi:carbonic anhydrase
MSVADELLGNNEIYASSFHGASVPMRPAKRAAVVACMDARLDPVQVLGLAVGDAHVLRNAGGLVTDDMIRSLMLSQRLQGTEEIILIHHSDCGMLKFREEELAAEIAADAGTRPPFELGAFPDVDADVLASIARIQASPFIPNRDMVRGFVYDDATGHLREVKG